MEQKISKEEFREHLSKVSQAFKDMYDPKYNTTECRGYDFVCTCHACPEQYDVYEGDYKDGKYVAYVRKRWGHLAVHPVENGEINWDKVIYQETENDPWNGTIDDKDYTFNKIVDAIHNNS